MDWYTEILLLLVPLSLLGVQASDLDIYYMHVTSDITYRYDNTLIESRMANRGANSTEATFLIQLPESAFISNFSMEIDGEIYQGMVREKEEAKKIYEEAKSKGKSAGHVSQKSREARVFRVAVNVAAESEVTFNLTYQELLRRIRGVYEHVIYIDPGQPIKDLSVDVNIQELRDINVLNVLALQPLDTNLEHTSGASGDALASIKRPTQTSAQISYQPSMEQQISDKPDGISAKFIIQYDVQRVLDGGEIYAVDGYFVHYFSPPLADVTVPNKNIVFVLDRSGSMSGTKIHQVKDAMGAILTQLKYGDYFNIITFASGITLMSESSPLIKLDSNSLERAQVFMQGVQANGGTNIHESVIRGLQLLKLHTDQNGYRPSLLVFLTDGQPSVGERNTDKIVEAIVAANTDEVAVFSLGFGADVQFEFLKKISLRNNGFARKIYLASDAALQLRNFYQEVGTPLLSRVDIRYLGDTVVPDSLTRAYYKLFFGGSEIVVAGKLAENHFDIISQIHALSGVGEMSLNATSTTSTPPGGLRGVTERLWAYLSIQQLLDAMLEETDGAKRKILEAEALQLSLEYHFVTPLTSMVVTKSLAPGDQPTEGGPGNGGFAGAAASPQLHSTHTGAILLLLLSKLLI